MEDKIDNLLTKLTNSNDKIKNRLLFVQKLHPELQFLYADVPSGLYTVLNNNYKDFASFKSSDLIIGTTPTFSQTNPPARFAIAAIF